MFSKTPSTHKIVVFDDLPTMQCASGCESILIWKMLWLAKRPRVAWITEERGHVCCKISRDWVSLWAFLTGVFTKDTYRQWQAFSCLKFRSGTILMSSQMYFKTSIFKITADFNSLILTKNLHFSNFPPFFDFWTLMPPVYYIKSQFWYDFYKPIFAKISNHTAPTFFEVF